MAGLLTLVAIAFHLNFFMHAGPLWRDEINSVTFASMPSIAHAYESLRYDSFPLLSTVFLHGWVTSGLGSTDQGLRAFGLLVGLLVVASLWFSSRLLGGKVPVLSLALVGINPWVVRTVDSLRPYGLGVAFIVATVGAVWKAAQTARPKWFVIAGVLAVGSVQCMYQNSFVLLATCVAGAIVSARARHPKSALIILGLGAIAAASLAIYLPSIRAAQDWGIIVRGPVAWGRIRESFLVTVGMGDPARAWAWIPLAAIALAVGLKAIFTKTRESREAREGTLPLGSLAIYCVTILVVGSVVYMMAIKSTRLETTPWYYVPLIVPMAAVVDAATGAIAGQWRRNLRVVLALAAAVTLVAIGWKESRMRWSNIDLVAERLAKDARPGDAIVINPFWIGQVFLRYYHGSVPWVTVPPLADYKIVRYDLVKAAMATRGANDPALDLIARTLQSGHRVYWVGAVWSGKEQEPPPRLPPAPLRTTGWYLGPYLLDWGRQAAYTLESHALSSELLNIPTPVPVAVYENALVTVVSGWR